MKKILVSTPSKSYPIIISDDFKGLLALLNANTYSKVALISDTNVMPLYGEALVDVCASAGIALSKYAFPAGEANKHLGTMADLYAFCVDAKLDRKSLILALGGGVVGDMVGFLAATYMRGIDFAQVPTSLLAQVDSSVGGKTGIDFKGYKNLIGAFYQPEFVYINTATLKTLPKRELDSGMGEVIKHGCILDRDYLIRLMDLKDAIMAFEHDAIEYMVLRSCEIKAQIVAADEKEMGVRVLLNFGHTFGHAIEKALDFKWSHGACVAVGMRCATALSERLGLLSKDDRNLIEATLEKYDLKHTISGLSPDTLYNDMFLDKKTAYDTLKLILLDAIGHAVIQTNVPDDAVKAAILSVFE